MDLSQFYDEHIDKVYKFFYIKSLERMTAEDLTSQTFMLFMEQTKSAEINDHKKYLYGIMRNVWLQFLRDKYDHAISSVELMDNFEQHAEEKINEFDEASEPAGRLIPFLNKLPPKQKQVLTMRIIDNKSVSDVAFELGKDKNYVKTTHQRALRRLREILSKPYMEVES